MKFNKQERLEIGRKICESGISNLQAAKQLGISEESARRYRILYEKEAGLVHDSSTAHKGQVNATISFVPVKSENSKESYEDMSKEELIEELMKSKVREARLKKGYTVKGVGADKEFIPLDNKNTK